MNGHWRRSNNLGRENKKHTKNHTKKKNKKKRIKVIMKKNPDNQIWFLNTSSDLALIIPLDVKMCLENDFNSIKL